MQSGGMIRHGQIFHDSTVLSISTGNFTGDGTQNRAIPHSLGKIPHMVFVLPEDGVPISVIIESDGMHSISTTGFFTVSAMDSTNFYVGNAGQFRGNENTYYYRWIAL